jgi:O-antigen ligase
VRDKFAAHHKGRYFKDKDHRTHLFFFLFAGIGLLALTKSYYHDVILLSILQLLRLWFVFFLVKNSNFGSKVYERVLQITAALVIFETFWVLLQRIENGPIGRDLEVYLPGFDYGIVAAEDQEMFRSTGTFYEPSVLGTFLLVQLTLLTQHLFARGRLLDERSYLIKKVAIFAGIVAIIFTASRGIYALTAVLAAYFVWRHKDQADVFIKKNFSWFLSALAVLLAALPYLIARLVYLGSLFGDSGSGTYRIQIALYAAKLAVMNVFGVGLSLSHYFFATFFRNDKFIFDPAYPHNVFFQVLAETGILGLIFYGLFLTFAFRLNQWKEFKANLKNPFILAALVYLLCAQFYPIFLHNQEILTYLFLYLGLGYSYRRFSSK